MNKMIATLIGSAALMSTPVAFAQSKGFHDTAKVVDVKPIYKVIEVASPEKHCWTEPTRRHEIDSPSRHDARVGAITGAIVGGIVGNQFGDGRGKDAMTVTGAVLGSVIGKQVAGQYDRSIQRVDYRVDEGVRHCETRIHYEKVDKLVGYRVTYRYHGETFTTRTDTHPGKRIEVKVNVRPAKAVYMVDHRDQGNGRHQPRTRNF